MGNETLPEKNVRYSITAPQVYDTPERCAYGRRAGDMYSVLVSVYRLTTSRNQFSQTFSDCLHLFARQLGIFRNYIDRNPVL